MPSHYLNQCWNIVNWTPWNKHQWNVNRNSYIFIQENPFENVVWKMAAILSRPQCVKGNVIILCSIHHYITARFCHDSMFITSERLCHHDKFKMCKEIYRHGMFTISERLCHICHFSRLSPWYVYYILNTTYLWYVHYIRSYVIVVLNIIFQTIIFYFC